MTAKLKWNNNVVIIAGLSDSDVMMMYEDDKVTVVVWKWCHQI